MNEKRDCVAELVPQISHWLGRHAAFRTTHTLENISNLILLMVRDSSAELIRTNPPKQLHVTQQWKLTNYKATTKGQR